MEGEQESEETVEHSNTKKSPSWVCVCLYIWVLLRNIPASPLAGFDVNVDYWLHRLPLALHYGTTSY